jgi:streptomycin 6-kinase
VARWDLKLGEPYTENATCSFVTPCIRAGKDNLVLKIGYPHFEALDEIKGLRRLRGRSVVELIDADESVNSMLLEQCVPGTQLSDIPEKKQDIILSKILNQIWLQKDTSGFRHVSTMIDDWNLSTRDRLCGYPDPDLAREGCEKLSRLARPMDSDVLLATDLHAGNVLRSSRMEWLGIDLKPFVGDRAYDLTQHLLNCIGRLKEAPLKTVERVAKLSNVDAVRLKKWMFARLATEYWLGDDQRLAKAFL